MKRIGAALLAAAAALLLLMADTLPTPQAQPTPSRFHDARLSHLLGMSVEDPNAQSLGKVKDFVLDASSAQVEYALVGSGGVLEVGGRTQALPATALSIATIVRGILSTGITRQQWSRFASFNGDLAALPDPPPTRRSATGHIATGRAARQGHLELASKLLGATVVNRNHQNLGTITDLLLDLDRQKPALVLIRNAKFLRQPRVFAVSLPLLARAEDGELLLDSSLPRLEQAPLFSEQSWSEAASQGAQAIYRVAASTET